MDKLTAIKGALCIIAAIVSISAFGDQLAPKASDGPAMGIQRSRGKLSRRLCWHDRQVGMIDRERFGGSGS
jgi:hypothetical protein